MKTFTDLITKAERELLERKVLHDVGSYRKRGINAHVCQFRVTINSINLINLIDSARYGARIYELLSIQRPGDLLHYLWVDISLLDDGLVKGLENSLENSYIYETSLNPKLKGVSFLAFDKYFYLFPDDNEPENVIWRRYVDFDKEHQFVNELIQLYTIVDEVQRRIIKSDDELIKQEIALIQQKKHPQDYIATIDRKSLNIKLEPQWEKYLDFYSLVENLAFDEEIQSISCPFGGYEIWRILVKAQVQRMKKTGLAAKEALALYGPDEGLGQLIKPENWGGKVTIPYEGMRMANMMFLPSWRAFHLDKAGINGSLKDALSSDVECKYLLVPKDRDFGELECAIRTVVDGWILYK